MVASYSGFYRIPFNTGQGLREHYDRMPVNFGYDEVTHKFNLPPPTGNPELIIFASRSVSDTTPNLGPISPVTNGPAFDINSQFASRSLTYNNDLGFKFTVPLREFSGVRSAVSFGLDYKSYLAKSFNTNLTYFTLYSLDQYGNRTLVTNTTTATGFNGQNELYYLPLSFGWTASRPDKTGVTSFYWNQNVFLTPLASARTNFQTVAQSAAAGGNYTTANLGLTRDQKLPHDWSLQLRANGQWASAPVISNEQFGLGGTSGVRGYQEGEAYGDTGWRVLFDVRAPPVNIGYFPLADGDLPAELRCSWFTDYGRLYALERPSFAGHSLTEWGTGFGLLLTIGEHFDARLSVAWALQGAAVAPAGNANRIAVQTPAGNAQAYFSIGFQF
jgi:outer membrane protein assembly factor BamA